MSPPLELLRVKLILISKDYCPPVVYHRTLQEYPHALSQKWFTTPKHTSAVPSDSNVNIHSQASPVPPSRLVSMDGATESNSKDLMTGDEDEIKTAQPKQSHVEIVDLGSDGEDSDTIDLLSDVEDNFFDSFQDGDSKPDAEEDEKEEARFIIMDANGWVFREVATEETAARRSTEPGMYAGRGVHLFINDQANFHLHAAIAREPERCQQPHVWGVFGFPGNRHFVQREEQQLRTWAGSFDTGEEWDERERVRSPLWFVVRRRLVELRVADGAGGGC